MTTNSVNLLWSLNLLYCVPFCSPALCACREEGLLCGGSCGSVMVGALEAAKTLKAGQRCVGEWVSLCMWCVMWWWCRWRCRCSPGRILDSYAWGDLTSLEGLKREWEIMMISMQGPTFLYLHFNRSEVKTSLTPLPITFFPLYNQLFYITQIQFVLSQDHLPCKLLQL